MFAMLFPCRRCTRILEMSDNKAVFYSTSAAGVRSSSAPPACQRTSQTEISTSQPVPQPRLRAVRGKMPIAPPVAPVSLHHLPDSSYWEQGGRGEGGQTGRVIVISVFTTSRRTEVWLEYSSRWSENLPLTNNNEPNNRLKCSKKG